jgi:hypothetical protein
VKKSSTICKPLLALLAAAIAVRAWMMLAYGPAFVGFGDSHEYVTAALVGVFHDVQKPAGYPIFLVVLHALSDSLTFAILVQHALGLATGLLLYGAVRHSGAPRWLGLLPAAVAFFGGTGLLLEHSLLADPLFSFLQALGVYCAARALAGRAAARWALGAGLCVGASFWVKTVGLSSLPVLVPVLALGAAGTPRRRLTLAGLAGACSLALVLGYVGVQALATGYVGYERQDAWNLYGRVATFVDCRHFTPPPGTRFLCPSQPPGRRLSESYYQYATAAPAVRRYGGPAKAPAAANATLQRFSLAAIRRQPLAYAGAILQSLALYISPRLVEGYTPTSIREALLEAKGTRSIEPTLAAYYPDAHGYRGSAADESALDFYERHTRIEGPLLVAMLLAALAGTVLLRGRERACALLFTLTALCSVALAAAGNSYDARYGYPAFGPLAAGAALGAWALSSRLRALRRPPAGAPAGTRRPGAFRRGRATLR